MEEQQIQEFIHQASVDETMRKVLISDPVAVIRRQGFSPRVTYIILHLLPHLSFEQPLNSGITWWHA
jgi:hypothetical protein